MLTKINYHLENVAPTPYREALLHLKRRVEAAQRGEVPVALPSEPPAEETAVATPGQPA